MERGVTPDVVLRGVTKRFEELVAVDDIDLEVHPGEFLALVRELRDSRASSYTLFDTPMFTCELLDVSELADHIGLSSR